MLESVTTGKTAAELSGSNSSFELMSRSPENVGIFNSAMADLTRLVTPAILHAYDFSKISHLMDVGSGMGGLVGAITREVLSFAGQCLISLVAPKRRLNILSALGLPIGPGLSPVTSSKQFLPSPMRSS